MSGRQTCETCRHWIAHDPVEVPPPYKKPEGFLARMLSDRWDRMFAEMNRNSAIEHNNSGRCTLMPEHEQTHREHFCGQW